MTINNRILQIINKFEQGIRADFARKIGVQRQYISNLIRDGYPVGQKIITGIINNYPEIDANWLTSGEGDMLKPVKTPDNNITTTNTNNNTNTMTTKDPKSLEQFVKYLLQYNSELLQEINMLRDKVGEYSKKNQG